MKTRQTFSPQQLSVDHFEAISDWYHFAIMELTRVKGFSENSEWIAKKLGISKKESEEAVARLFRLNLLRKDAKGRVVVQDHTNIESHAISTIGKRNFQKQVLSKAIKAMDTIPVELRNQTSMTFACNSKMFPILVKELSKFRHKFTDKAESYGEFDQVYHLSISLYPVLEQNFRKKEKTHETTLSH